MLRSINPTRAAKRAERLAAEIERAKASRRAALMAGVGRMARMGPARTEAAPKTEARRNRALLDMAEGRACLLRVPGICCEGRTVACHSNLSSHGKAGARKADDQFSVWGCPTCHRWLDQGPAPASRKKAMFMAAHFLQVGEWRHIAVSKAEPLRFQQAAQWALDQLNATPVVGLDDAP